MFQVLVITVFLSLAVREAFGRPLLQEVAGESWRAWAIGVGVGGPALFWLIAHLVTVACARGLDRRGRANLVALADTSIVGSRHAMCAAHALAVIGFGWLDLVRAWVGDVVLADELVACAPVLAALSGGWWSMAPIERRVREAMMIRRLDAGGDVRPHPSRWRATWLGVRMHVLLLVVPLALIHGWNEAAQAAWTQVGPDEAAEGPEGARLIALAAQLAGVVVVLALTPPLLCWVWGTVSLPAGPLREMLEALCRRYRVRVRDIRVWRTDGTMLNAAVIGVLRPLRYILMTDALLEHLSDAEVEAVMAHEVAHVKRRHMIWLALGMFTTLLTVGVATGFAAWALGVQPTSRTSPAFLAVQAGSLAVSAAGVLLVFGFMSRRFEWEADAFAARHISESEGAGVVTPHGAATVVSALQGVAEMNHVPVHRSSWRHGSIASRQRRVLSLVGRTFDQLPVDRVARRVRAATLSAVMLLAAAGLGSVLVEWLTGPGGQ